MFKKVLLCILILSSFSIAQYDRPGSTTAQFLKIGISPRATAMGNAYISPVTGVESVFYNVAALAWIKNFDLQFNYLQWFAGIKHNFAGLAYSFNRVGTVAISVVALYTDQMKVRTPLRPDGTGETFYVGNYKFGLSFAKQLTDHVSFGLSFNYIYMSLHRNFNARTIATDVGLMYRTKFRNFRFGMRIMNFGSDVKFVNEAYPLPTNFGFGLSLNILEMDNGTLLFSLSAIKPNDGKPLGNLGFEWTFLNIYFFRVGYHLNNEVTNYSFGLGLKLKIEGMRVNVDYALAPYNLLGTAHHIGLGFNF